WAGPYPPGDLAGMDYAADSRTGPGGAHRAWGNSRADGHCAGKLREGAEEASEALRAYDPRARWKSVPIHRGGVATGRREHRSHPAAVARREGFVGELRVVKQGGELEEGQPPAA